MDEILLEGKKIVDENDPAATSADEETVETATDEKVELNSNPVPTEEEMENANIDVNEPEQAHETVLETVDVNPTVEKTFTQSQVNDIVGKTRFETREKTFRYIYERYGVNDEEGLDTLVGDSQRFETLKSQYDEESKGWATREKEREKELQDIKEQVALLQSGIDKERFEDALFILRGKGLPVTSENIFNELATHPEWKKTENPNFNKIDNTPAEPETKISVLGNKPFVPKKETSEEDEVLSRFYKV